MDIIKSMVLRLDAGVMAKLEQASDDAKQSREMFVRSLVYKALGIESYVPGQRNWYGGHRRYSHQPRDMRIKPRPAPEPAAKPKPVAKLPAKKKAKAGRRSARAK